MSKKNLLANMDLVQAEYLKTTISAYSSDKEKKEYIAAYLKSMRESSRSNCGTLEGFMLDLLSMPCTTKYLSELTLKLKMDADHEQLAEGLKLARSFNKVLKKLENKAK